MTAVVGVLSAVVVVLGVMVVGLLRSHAEILRRLHRLDGGDEHGRGAAATEVPVSLRATTSDSRRPAIDIAGAGLTDDVVVINVAGARHRTLLAFLSSTCGTCGAFWHAFRHGEHVTLPADVRLVVVARSEPNDDRVALRELAAPDIVVVLSEEAWNDYAVQGSPYFVLVDPIDGVIGEGTGLEFVQLRRLLAQATGDAAFLGGGEPGPAPQPQPQPSGRVSGGRNDSLRIDQELLAAGLRPNDPALYPPDEAPEA
jgi:hypothetical protein